MSEAIPGFNVDMECDMNCADCEKYFHCEIPSKKKDLLVGRMARARETLRRDSGRRLLSGTKGALPME